MSASSTLNQPKKQSRLDQVLSSRPAIDHDLQPSPTPSIAASTPQKRRNQQAHLMSNHFTPTKNARSSGSAPSTAKKSNGNSTPSSSKKRKTSSKSELPLIKKPNNGRAGRYPGQAAEDDEEDELDSDPGSTSLEAEDGNLVLPATPASSIATSSGSDFNLIELIHAGKVQESPRRGRRVAKVDMGWISPSARLQKDGPLDLGEDEISGKEKGGKASKAKGKGKGNGREIIEKVNHDVSTSADAVSSEPARVPSWTSSFSDSLNGNAKSDSLSTPPPVSSSTRSNGYGVTLIDSKGWAAAGVLGKGERVPYMGSPAQDGVVGLGIGQNDDQVDLSQKSSDDIFNSYTEETSTFQLPSRLQPSYDPLSGFSFNRNGSGSPAPASLKPQEAGRGEGLGTKLVPFEVSGIGRMALHEELVFNLDFLDDNNEASSSNSRESFPLHRSSDAGGSTSGSSGASRSSNSTNLTSVGTPGSWDHSSAPLSGPSPSFSLCSNFPASEPRTPHVGPKSVPNSKTTQQALAAVLNFGGGEPAKESTGFNSLKLKRPPSAQTLKKLQEVRELVRKAREASKKRKLQTEQSMSGSDSHREDSSNKRPKHSLRLVGVETDHVALALPSLAWPDAESPNAWSSNAITANSGSAEKESIIRWLELRPPNLSRSSSEYELDAEQVAELEENQLQWSQHPMVAKALRDRARKEDARRMMELQMAREQRARDRAYGRASARSHAQKAGDHYPRVRRAARASVRQRARKELKAHPDALDGISASKHRHKLSGAYLIQPPAPVYNPSPKPQISTPPRAKGRRAPKISVKAKGEGSKDRSSRREKQQTSSSSPDAIFGCNCGRGDDDEDTPPMVQCDNCNKWHHLPCIGVEHEDQLDAEWYCDECCSPQGLLNDPDDAANSVATDPLDLELEPRSPASESSFNVLSTPKTNASTSNSTSGRFSNGHRLVEPVFAQPTDSPMRNMRQPLAASALALAPSPPMMSSSRYRGPLIQDSQGSSQFAHSSIYASPGGYHPHAHQPRDERFGRGRVRAERIGGWLNVESSEAQDSDGRKEEGNINEIGSPLARKSTLAKKSDLFFSHPQDLGASRRISTSAQSVSRPRTPTTPRLVKEGQGLKSPVMGLSTPSRHARFEKRSSHQFSDDEDLHSHHRRDQDDVLSTPSRLMSGSASWGYSRGGVRGSTPGTGSRTPGKSTLPSLSRGDLFGEASGGHHRRESSQWGLPSALRTPSRDVVSRGSESFTPNLAVDHSGGYSVGLPSLVFSSGGLDLDSHPPSYSNHPSSSSDYHHHHHYPSSSSSNSRAWQLQSPTSGVARARQSSASHAHSLGLGTPGGMLKTPELQPTFNRGNSNNSSVRGTAYHSKSRVNARGRDRERSRSPSPTKRSRNGSRNASADMTLPALKKAGGKSNKRVDQESEDEHHPTSSSPFPPTPTFEGQIRRLESSMDDSTIPSSARKLASLSGEFGHYSTPLSKSYSQPSANFARTPPSEESNRLALSALLDSPAELGGQNRKRNPSGLGIGLALDDVLDWS